MYKAETFHGVCLQKKMKEEKAVRRSMRGTVTNKSKVERVHQENLKTEIDSSGKLVFADGSDGAADGVADAHHTTAATGSGSSSAAATESSGFTPPRKVIGSGARSGAAANGSSSSGANAPDEVTITIEGDIEVRREVKIVEGKRVIRILRKKITAKPANDTGAAPVTSHSPASTSSSHVQQQAAAVAASESSFDRRQRERRERRAALDAEASGSSGSLPSASRWGLPARRKQSCLETDCSCMVVVCRIGAPWTTKMLRARRSCVTRRLRLLHVPRSVAK